MRHGAQTGGYAIAHASLQLSGTSVKHQDFTPVAMKSAEDMGRQMTGAEWLDSLPAVTVADKRVKEIPAGYMHWLPYGSDGIAESL